MEANAVIQVALLAVLPLIMQGLKKIVWVEQNKGWVCPLLCIAVSVVAAYMLKLPQWLLVGILTGAACNKVYDWSKDIKAGMILLLLLLPMVCVVGCSQVQMSPEYSQQLEMSAINVNQLNQRCQGGDNEACKQGLAKAAETLDLLVDGLHGVDSTAKGGDTK